MQGEVENEAETEWRQIAPVVQLNLALYDGNQSKKRGLFQMILMSVTRP